MDGEKKRLLIWGAGDQGSVTLECALATGRYGGIDLLELREKTARPMPGHPVYREEEVDLAGFLSGYDEAIVATGSNDLRERKTALLDAMGIPLATIVHPTAIVSPSAAVSGGCTVLAQAVIHTNARVGLGCIVNTHAVVEHDCVVGDYVNICPRVAIAGHVSVGRRAYLGIGSTVIDQISIGEDAYVGAGAVVIRDVPDHATVVGVPAKRIMK